MRQIVRVGLGVPALCLSLFFAAPAGATLYLSPSGSDAAACTPAAPCRTFDRAYRLAPAGSDVQLAAGNYGQQSLTNLPVKATAGKVVFHPAAGAAVTVPYLDIVNSDNIEVQSVATNGWGIRNGAAHIILRNVGVTDATSTGAYFAGSDDVQVIGGEIARVDPEDGIHMNNAGGPNSNITIDGLFEHDLTRNRDPSSHDDCLQTGDVTNLVIRNSRFFNCGTQGIFLNPYNGGATKNITLENNWFGTAQLGYNIVYVGEAQNVVMRNNSFTGSMYVDAATSSGVQMIDNILDVDAYTCQTLAAASDVFDYNASPYACSGAKHHIVKANIDTQFTNAKPTAASGFDLHLKAGAAAIDKGSPTASAANDFDGQARPIGGAPDIGADEYGTGPLGPPGTNPGTTGPTPPGGGTTGGGTGTGTGGTTTGGGSTTTPAKTTSPAATAASNVLAALPPSTAATFRAVDTPKVGTKAPLTLAGVDDARICRSARKGCKASTRLRIAVSKATKLNIVFRKVRPGHRMKIVRVTAVKLHKGANVVRITGRGLAKARYHLILRAPNGASADVPLTVA